MLCKKVVKQTLAILMRNGEESTCYTETFGIWHNGLRTRNFLMLVKKMHKSQGIYISRKLFEKCLYIIKLLKIFIILRFIEKQITIYKSIGWIAEFISITKLLGYTALFFLYICSLVILYIKKTHSNKSVDNIQLKI